MASFNTREGRDSLRLERSWESAMSDSESKSRGSGDLLAAAMRRVYREQVEDPGEPLQRQEDTAATEVRSEQAETAE